MRIPIKDYEDLYELDTEDYQVYRCGKNKPLVPTLNGTGKYNVALSRNGNSENRYIHRIVAELLVPNDNPKEKILVGFKNDDFTNWKPENLYWMSNREKYNTSTATKKSKYADRLKSGYVITDHKKIFIGCCGMSDVAQKLGRTKDGARGVIERHSKINSGPYKDCWVEKRQLLCRPVLDENGQEVK